MCIVSSYSSGLTLERFRYFAASSFLIDMDEVTATTDEYWVSGLVSVCIRFLKDQHIRIIQIHQLFLNSFMLK